MEPLEVLLTSGVIFDPRRPAPLRRLGVRKMIGASYRFWAVMTDGAPGISTS